MSNPKVAIITLLRKGSKRLPGKNKLPFRGKPLYRHTVDFAVELSKEIGSPYYLLHDYDDIPDIPGCNQITGLPNFGGDVHNTSENIKDSGVDADVYILLQATSPLRKLATVVKHYNDFLDIRSYAEASSGCSVYKLKEKFYYIGQKEGYKKNYINRTYSGASKRPLYNETGSYYFFNKDNLQKTHCLGSGPSFLMEDDYNIDLDTKEDYERLIKEYE